MKYRTSFIALAIIAAIGSFAALPALSAPLTMETGIATFGNSASVVDGGTDNDATSNDNASLGSSPIQQFNSSNGVLMGATVNLSKSTQTQTTQVTSTDGRDNGNNKARTSSGTGSSSVAISAPGVSTTFALLTQADSCAGYRQQACSDAASTTSFQTILNQLVPSGSLNSYVGGATVTVARQAATLTALQQDDKFNGAKSTTSTVNWSGELSATYQYLLHAAPTFGNNALTLDLDLGTVAQGASIAPRGFSILNTTGGRVGLDLDSVTPSGNLAQLYADLTGFSALAAGSSKAFFASFNTATLGNFLSTYTLNLSDADVGAANSRSNYTMTLNLKGNVASGSQRLANDVPEPGMLALASIGLLGLVLIRRRARRT